MKPYVVLDTETAPQENFDARNMAKTSLVYDFGYVITDGETVFCERSFIIAETFYNDNLMQSAYYAEKIPMYRAGMGEVWEVASFLTAWRIFKEDCTKYGVKDMFAYNARFDRDVLNHTIEFYSNGFVKFFFPYKMRIKDIWTMAGGTICATKKYVKWCMTNGYISPSGNPKTSAEIVYRYVTKDAGFIEAHTALNDAKIENEILKKIRKRHQKTNTKPNGTGWRSAAAIARVLK